MHFDTSLRKTATTGCGILGIFLDMSAFFYVFSFASMQIFCQLHKVGACVCDTPFSDLGK